MSLYLHTDNDEQLPLASNAGWGLVGDWIEGLKGQSLLKRLWRDGWAEPVGELRSQLANAIREDIPVGDAAHTVKELYTVLMSLPTDSAVVVSDGMSE